MLIHGRDGEMVNEIKIILITNLFFMRTKESLYLLKNFLISILIPFLITSFYILNWKLYLRDFDFIIALISGLFFRIMIDLPIYIGNIGFYLFPLILNYIIFIFIHTIFYKRREILYWYIFTILFSLINAYFWFQIYISMTN